MKKVTGLGGIFLKCRDVEQTRAWYAKHLGIQIEDWGAQFNWSEETNPKAYSVLSFFRRNTGYFDPSQQPFMINFRVADLDALILELRREGVEIVGEPVDEEFGKFAWIMDPEGNKLELWQQPEVVVGLEGL